MGELRNVFCFSLPPTFSFAVCVSVWYGCVCVGVWELRGLFHFFALFSSSCVLRFSVRVAPQGFLCVWSHRRHRVRKFGLFCVTALSFVSFVIFALCFWLCVRVRVGVFVPLLGCSENWFSIPKKKYDEVCSVETRKLSTARHKATPRRAISPSTPYLFHVSFFLSTKFQLNSMPTFHSNTTRDGRKAEGDAAAGGAMLPTKARRGEAPFSTRH